MTLLQRVIAGNALVVFVGALILALSPATISPQHHRQRGAAAGRRRGRGAGRQRRAHAARAGAAAVAGRRDGGRRPAATGAAARAARGRRGGRGPRPRVRRRWWTGCWPSATPAPRRAIAAQEAERRADRPRAARRGRPGADRRRCSQLEGLGGRAAASCRRAGGAREAAARGGRRRARDRPRAAARAAGGLGLRGALVGARVGAGRPRAAAGARASCDRALPPLAPTTELVVYRVAQEALTNVARHAGARGRRSPRGRRAT